MTDKPEGGGGIFGEGESPESREVPMSMAERLRERPFLWGAVAVVLVLVIGLAVSYAVHRPSEPKDSSLGGFDPVEGDASGATDADALGSGGSGGKEADADNGDTADGASAPGASGSAGDAGAGDDAEIPAPAPMIAYRLDGALWVAREDGAQAVRLTDAERGTFALSPDGETLAYVDANAGEIFLVNVDSGTSVDVGPAEDVRPCWAADSSLVAYTAVEASALKARVVGPGGSGGVTVGAGHTPCLSPDGSRIVFVAHSVPGEVGTAIVADADGSNAGGIGVKASEIVWGGDGLVFAISEVRPGEERILTCAVDGSLARVIVPEMGKDKPVMYASLLVSPDGERLAYAAHGDDGFSRAEIVEFAEPSRVSLSVRRDTYPVSWSATGERLYFVEGNAFQGEPTSLLSATVEGLGRTEVVSGAGL